MAFETLLTEEQIAERVKEIGQEISADYAGRTVHLICVLKGAYTFLADLARAMSVPVTIDFLAVSSYGKGKTSSGEVQLTKDLDVSLSGRDVIVVEDIADTGITLSYLLAMLESRQPKSLKVAAFLSKPSRREVEVPVDYVGFEVPDRFVVGYGLDDDQRYRELPYVAVVVD